MQDVVSLSQEEKMESQELEQLSQVSADEIQWMDMEAFAAAAGKTQQGISYLINKGRLKPFRDEGIRIKKTDKWYLDATLVQLVKTEQPLKTVDEKEALNNQLRSTQTALVKYREFEKRIETLEEENSQLVQQVQQLSEKTEEQLQALTLEKEGLNKVVQQLAQELEIMKYKPWWKFWM